MADLPTIAQRLNDVEINNNAPVTSQTNRRIGSSINFLLDFLGVANGETTAAGALGKVGEAKQTITWAVTPQVIPAGGFITLFTFTGDNDRHISWVKKASGFNNIVYTPNVNIEGGGFVNGPNFDPFFHVLQMFQTMIGIGGQPFANTIDLRVNGVSVQTLKMPLVGGEGVVTQTRSAQCAPAGVNTVTAHNMRTFNLTLFVGTGPHTYEKIFI